MQARKARLSFSFAYLPEVCTPLSASTGFVHLGARSELSTGESIARVEELCWEASRDEQGFLGLTDVQSLGNAPAFAAATARAGLRPVFGAELRVLPCGETHYRGQLYKLRVFVEDERGWRTLLRLVNATRHSSAGSAPGHIPAARVLEDTRGLIICLGGTEGELSALLRAGDLERAEWLTGEFHSAAGPDGVLIELPFPPGGDNVELSRALQATAAFFSLPCIVVPEVCCAHPADDPVFHLLSGRKPPAPGQVLHLGDLVRPARARRHLLPRHLVAEECREFRRAMANTLEVARRCAAFELPRLERRFPVHDFHRGVDAESYLWNTAFSKATERYGDIPARYKERLNREFREIVEAGLANAVVTLVRLNQELEADGVQCGPGAGIFTNSLIASLLGLTRLDPLRFDLNFALERGLSTGPFPLLELSIPSNQETEAREALARLFEDQVSAVGEWRTARLPAIMERVAELLQRDGRWASAMSRQEDFLKARERAAQLPATYLPDLSLPLTSPEFLAWLSRRLEGRFRELRPAKGVYTFSVDPLEKLVPCRPATNGDNAGGKPLQATEWTSDELAALRHARLRFTHPPLLDLIGEATAMARQQGDHRFAPENTPPDDPATYRLLREGETAGIVPLEAPLVRRRLRQEQPDDLHALISLLWSSTNGPQREDKGSFSDLLLCHVCASIKAQRPLAFFAAALTQASGDLRRSALLLEEVRRRQIRVTSLDINYSSWGWTVERDAIRPGFAIARAMTPTAGHEIISKRRELHFTGLDDLCRRLDRTRVRAPQLRALIQAGAFDGMDWSRTTLLLQLEEVYPLLAGKRVRPESAAQETGFFGHESGWLLSHHGNSTEETAAEEDAARLAAQELEACGLAIREVEDREEEEFLRAARVQTGASLALKQNGKAVTLLCAAGPVQADSGAGNTACLDAGGCLVVAKNGLHEQLLAEEIAGQPLVLTGKLRREPFQWFLDLEAVSTLDAARQRAREAGLLRLDLAKLPGAEHRALLALLKAFPGPTPVAMEWMPAQPGWTLRRIASRKVLLCPLLASGLSDILGPDCWRVEEHDTRPAREQHHAPDLFRRYSARLLRKLVPGWRSSA